jgi:hypothetical protein
MNPYGAYAQPHIIMLRREGEKLNCPAPIHHRESAMKPTLVRAQIATIE